MKEKKTLSPIRKISCDKDVVHTSSAKFRPHATEKTSVVALYLNRRLRSQVIHDLNTVNYCT